MIFYIPINSFIFKIFSFEFTEQIANWFSKDIDQRIESNAVSERSNQFLDIAFGTTRDRLPYGAAANLKQAMIVEKRYEKASVEELRKTEYPEDFGNTNKRVKERTVAKTEQPHRIHRFHPRPQQEARKN